MKTVLIFTDRQPKMSTDGGRSFLYSMHQYLQSKGYDVTTSVVPNDGLYYDSPATDQQVACLRRSLDNVKPQVVIVDHDWRGGLLKHVPHDVQRILYAHDVRTRMIRGYERSGNTVPHYPWTDQLLADSLKSATAILVHNEDDVYECRRLCGQKSTTPIIQVGVPSDIFPHDSAEMLHDTCLFVGSGAWENVIAVKWLIDRVWPEVIRRVPAASLVLVGDVCGRISPHQQIVPNISLTGPYEDAGEYYAQAKLCLIPSVQDGGIKGKFVAALAHGKASVANVCGIDGFPEAFATCVLATDDPGRFSDNIVSVLTNEERRLSMEWYARQIASCRLNLAQAFAGFLEQLRLGAT